MTSVKLMLLDGRGFPSKNAGSSLSLWVISHAQSPGWIRLAASLHARTFGDEPHARAQQQLWLAFLRSYADVLNPSYGQIGYNVSGGSTGETVLEDRLPVNFGRNRPQWTVGESRQVLRGYDWLTILSQENADRLGGATELVATGAFFDVASLVNGGVWLRATDDWRDYDRSSAERVFRVVAPVLRRGSPQPPSPSPFPVPAGYEKPYLIVFRDAASVD